MRDSVAEFRLYWVVCKAKGVTPSTWEEWERHGEYGAPLKCWEAHPRFVEFQRWMRETRGGERLRVPFPRNFQLWLDGKRW